MGNAGSTREYSGTGKENKRSKDRNAGKRRFTAPSSSSSGRSSAHQHHESSIPPVGAEAISYDISTTTTTSGDNNKRSDNSRNAQHNLNPQTVHQVRQQSSSPMATAKSDDHHHQQQHSRNDDRLATAPKSESIDIVHNRRTSLPSQSYPDSTLISGPESTSGYDNNPQEKGRRKTVELSDHYTQSLSEHPSQCFAEHLQQHSDPSMMADSENPKLQTVFKWDRGGKEVFVTGTFTQWKPIKMIQSQGDFFTVVDVPQGHHEYKFIVDGQEKTDPNSELDDRQRSNVLEVKKSDFEVFEALENDIANEEKNKIKDSRKREVAVDLSGSPPGVYSQEIPTGYEPSSSSSKTTKATNPPVLPPYLLEVILNNPKSFHDKILLPQPNHVMLNHLYALSIQDGVMVMSDIHRYRNKYVTTLFYKPI